MAAPANRSGSSRIRPPANAAPPLKPASRTGTGRSHLPARHGTSSWSLPERLSDRAADAAVGEPGVATALCRSGRAPPRTPAPTGRWGARAEDRRAHREPRPCSSTTRGAEESVPKLVLITAIGIASGSRTAAQRSLRSRRRRPSLNAPVPGRARPVSAGRRAVSKRPDVRAGSGQHRMLCSRCRDACGFRSGLDHRAGSCRPSADSTSACRATDDSADGRAAAWRCRRSR